MDAPGTAMLVVISSFAVDRIVSLVLFGVSVPKSWRKTFPDPELMEEGAKKRAAMRTRRMWYFCFAAILTIPIVIGAKIRIFKLLGIIGAEDDPAVIVADILVTTLVFVAGADRLADLIKKHAPAEKHEGIEVYGTLTINGEKKEAPNKCL